MSNPLSQVLGDDVLSGTRSKCVLLLGWLECLSSSKMVKECCNAWADQQECTGLATSNAGARKG